MIAILFNELQKFYNKFGITEVETNPELIENTAIQQLWKNYENNQHKIEQLYKTDLIMYNEGTIIALSSPPGSGAISIIRLSGKDSISITDKFLNLNLERN